MDRIEKAVQDIRDHRLKDNYSFSLQDFKDNVIRPNIIKFCQKKFASERVEKCLPHKLSGKKKLEFQSMCSQMEVYATNLYIKKLTQKFQKQIDVFKKMDYVEFRGHAFNGLKDKPFNEEDELMRQMIIQLRERIASSNQKLAEHKK